jgi:hypothetical protein
MSQTAGVLILSLVAAALVCAAVYAAFARPSTREAQERKQEIVNGFRLASGILLGFVLVGMFVASVGVGFFGNPARFSSKPLASGLAAVSLTLIAALAQRWAKYLGGWLGYGALNGLLMASSGHLLNNPAVPVRRSWALLITAVVLLTALVCLRFTKDYRLNLLDRIALVGWVVCFAVAANAERYGFPALAVGCVGLAFAWLYHKLLHPRIRQSRATRHMQKSA